MHLVQTPPPRSRPDPILRLDAVESLTGIKKSTIYALMKRGAFPLCVHITPRCVGWPESWIAKWLEDRKTPANDKQGAPGAAAAGEGVKP
ncbi:MAG: AlpA family phage regulatory protein [Pseudomonadota bacterium]